MNEFVIKLADERGRVMEQSHAAATAEELRARFTQAGYYVYSVKAKSLLGASKKKVKLENFLIFNQQFLTLSKSGLPLQKSLDLLARQTRSEELRAVLVLGDPALGVGFGGKRADGRRIAVRDGDFDAEGSIRSRDDAVAGLSMRMCSSHRYYMGARRRKAIAGSGPAAKRGRPALAAAPSRVHSAGAK